MESSLYEWAKREVVIAKKRFKAEPQEQFKDDFGFDSPDKPLDTILKAFKVLVNGCDSQEQWMFMQPLISQLILLRVISPITEEDDDWSDITSYYKKVMEDSENAFKVYQNERYTSLFKIINQDNSIEYHDNERAICIDENLPNEESRKANSFVNQLIDTLFPIELPYSPGGCFVYIECYLVADRVFDFDTIKLDYMEENNIRYDISRYYILDESDGEFVECDEAEFERRKEIIQDRIDEQEG